MKKSLTHKVIKHLLNYNNNLRIIKGVTCVYFIKITLHFIMEIGIQTRRTNFGIACSNCSMKLLSVLVVKIGILEISNLNLRAILILELIWPGI